MVDCGDFQRPVVVIEALKPKDLKDEKDTKDGEKPAAKRFFA